jgi:23S rRNA (adenine2503-C2)-methyltransferase
MTDATAPITQDVMTLPRKLPEGLPNLVGLTRDAMREALIAAGTPEKQAKMRVGQIWQWIYHWGVRDFDAMTNLAKDYRALLAAHFVVALPEVVTRQVSGDGTRKYLVRIAGGHEVEVVYIPETDRGTLVYFVSGRLHPDLFVLPYRDAEAGPQPDHRRDRGAGDARPRRSGRMAGAGGA